MRTTVTLDTDVAAAVDDVRRRQHVGMSEAVNQLIRSGLRAPEPRQVFRQRTTDLGLRTDVSNIAEALDVLDGSAAR